MRVERATVRQASRVDAVQARTLRELFARLEALRAKGGRGVVQVDLDLTALLPSKRTALALQAVGERFGVPELQRAERLSVLPGYTTLAFDAFLEQSGLREKYPNVDWGSFSADEGASASGSSLYAQFRAAFWYGATPGASRKSGYVGLERDAVAPGLADFVRQVRAAGGEVVFNSGRGASAQKGTLAALRAGGVERPRLLIGSDPKLDGGQVKALRQKELAALGTTVAIIDDRARNRQALAPEAPGAMLIAVAAPGFTAEPQTAKQKARISTFEQ